jgi:hypothetical protein
MSLMSMRGYARHRDNALRAVQKAIESGRISLVEKDGKRFIDSEAADAAWARNTDETKRSGLFENTPPPSEELAAADKADEPTASDTTEYRKARTEREQLRLEQERMDLAERKNESIAVADANILIVTAIRLLRDRVLIVPPRLKDELAAETDAAKVELMLLNALEDALRSVNQGAVLSGIDEDDDESTE